MYLFYTSWCPHCKKAQQPWYSFKELLKNREYTYGGKHIIFEEVNCEAERAKARREERRSLKADAGSDELPAPHVSPGPAKQVVHA